MPRHVTSLARQAAHTAQNLLTVLHNLSSHVLQIYFTMPQITDPDFTSCKSRSLRQKLISKFTHKERQIKLETPALGQQTSDQSQSILFTLPFELRELMWKFVLGLRMIHLQHLDGRLGFVKCTDDTGEPWTVGNHGCWYHGHANIGVRLPYEQCSSHSHQLGILMTCRQM